MHGKHLLHRGLQFLDRREHFLPVRPADLQEKMLEDNRLSPRERVLLGKLFEMIAQRFHMEFRSRLEHLKDVYEPFDPDLDTVNNGHGLQTCDIGQRAELVKAFEALLHDANYQEMSREEIVACTEYQANRNIVVRASFDDYADLRVFYRGVRHEARSFRSWHTPWRERQETVHVFARLALLVRLHKRQPESVFLKLFKNVVAEDLEMLLPYVRIRMKLFDRLKIGTSVVGGLGIASWKAWTAATLGPYVLLGLGAGLTGTCVNGVTNFVASKTRYVQKLTANLYFQNLANNQSMLAHVVDSAEGEECKELLLAYFLLYVERDRDFDQNELDRRAEQWLTEKFGVTVDFDVSMAVQKLIDKELVAEVCRSGPAASSRRAVLKVYDLPSALHRLDDAWEDCLENGELLTDDEHRLADATWPPFAAEGPKL